MRAVLALAILVASATATAKTPLPARGDHSVYDVANVIDDARERQIEVINAELFQRARVAIVVITVPRLVDETISDLAVRVLHDWGVGERGRDESVVIALSVEDREIFLATGYGSESYLPDGKVGEIRDHAIAFLRNNDFSTGIYTADLEIAQVAAAAHGVTLTGVPDLPPTRPSGDDEIFGVILVFLAIVVVVAILGRRGRGGRGGGGGFWVGAMLGSMFGNRGNTWGGGGGSEGGFGGFGGGSGGGGGAGGKF